MAKIEKKQSDRVTTFRTKMEKLQQDCREMKATEDELKVLLEKQQNRYEESMKYLMNSKIEEKLSQFFKEQSDYEDDRNRPDLEVIKASSLEKDI